MAKYYDRAWNPILGCIGDFKGCDNCFAKDLMLKRNLDKDISFTDVKINRNQFHKTFDTKPQLIAVCTQSDLFQDTIKDKFIDGVLRKCNNAKQNHYLFLTKYIDNMVHYFNTPNRMKNLNNDHINKFNLDNMMFGVTVCSNEDIHRIEKLKSISLIKHRFVAFEPVLEKIDFNANVLQDIDWVIVGAETGLNARKCDVKWLIDIVNKATEMNVPVFVNAIHLDNGKVTSEFDEMPNELKHCHIPFF